jgi:hypothetical protein
MMTEKNLHAAYIHIFSQSTLCDGIRDGIESGIHGPGSHL